MDDRWFDAVARSLASGSNRRRVLGGLLGLGGAVATGVTVSDSEAARRPTPTPKPVTCPGIQTWDGFACVCPNGAGNCGSDCCPADAQCCDSACCFGICYGEELCCPLENWCDSSGTCCSAGTVCCGAAGCVPGEACCAGIPFDPGTHFCCGDTIVAGACCELGGCAEGVTCCAGACVDLRVTGNCCDSSHCNTSDLCRPEVCENSVCVAGASIECPAPIDQCRLGGSCDPATGECIVSYAPYGTPCSDGNPHCIGGACCTIGHEPINGGCFETNELSDFACNDGCQGLYSNVEGSTQTWGICATTNQFFSCQRFGNAQCPIGMACIEPPNREFCIQPC